MEIHRNEPVNPVIKRRGRDGDRGPRVGEQRLPVRAGHRRRHRPPLQRVPGNPLFPDRQRGHDDPAADRADAITIEAATRRCSKRIYEHVQSHHPGRAILLTRISTRIGPARADGAETLTALALVHMDPDKVIVAVNAYEPDAVSQYRGPLSGSLRAFRVWVTESGIADPRPAGRVRARQ